ncbi:MAG: peptidoglycan DD-metalloendopeptidase family protein [Candidatus Eisenbacteria bacterium]
MFAADPSPRAGKYVWPLAYRGCLSSSFAEYRQGHFHAGIDLATGGKTGFKVRAIADGEIYRVKASPFGYGKVVYLALPDGKIAVYAHLSDFAPHIREVVEREQIRLNRYSVEVRLPSRSIPVSAGEVIGYSGQTGVGAPHLHFELRDGEDVPLNPILHGFPVEDSSAPVIRSVVLTPLEGDSRVDGRIRPLTLDLEWSPSELCYRTERVVRIEGPVGVMIHCDDRQTSCDHRLGVYRIDLRVDEEIAYRTRFDQFSFDKAMLVGIEFDQGRIDRGGGQYHRLYTTATNLLPFTLTDRRHAGVIVGATPPDYGDGLVLTTGPHKLEATAGDANGNDARAVLGLVVGETPEVRRAQVVEDGEVTVFIDRSPSEIGDLYVARSLNGGRHWEARRGRYEIDRGAWVADGFPELQTLRKPLLYRVELSTIEGAHGRPLFIYRNYEDISPPEPAMDLSIEYWADAALVVLETDRAYPYRVEAKVIRDGREPLRPVMEQVDATRYEGIIPLQAINSEKSFVTVTLRGRDDREWSSLQEIRAVRVSALGGGEVRSVDGLASIRFPRSALVRDTHFRVIEGEGPPLERGLTYTSPVYRFEPADALLRGNALISIRPFVDGGEGKRVALYRGDAHGRWQYIGRGADPGRPEVSAETTHLSSYALIRDEAAPTIFGLRPENGSAVSTRKPRLQAKVADIGSGFEAEDVEIRLDGRKVIAEYDPERNLIFYVVRTPLAAGSHKVAVIATDRAGNAAKSEATFYISGE